MFTRYSSKLEFLGALYASLPATIDRGHQLESRTDPDNEVRFIISSDTEGGANSLPCSERYVSLDTQVDNVVLQRS